MYEIAALCILTPRNDTFSMKELISVIIPIYNRVHLLPKVLDSIKRQIYKNIEIIVVDDGSDEKVEVDDSVKLIRQENKGAPSARNRGLEEAKGEYVIFWDADVIGESEMLEKMCGELQENSEASYAYCNHETSIIKYITKKIPARKFDESELEKNNYIHSTSLIRRKDVMKWDESLKRFQDWDLWLGMAEKGKAGVWVDEYLFTILGGGTMSGWLPRIAYGVPFKCLPGISKRVREYEDAKKVVLEKHKLK
jgi:glycosyltransferase involved in cell wall biosynthesis